MGLSRILIGYGLNLLVPVEQAAQERTCHRRSRVPLGGGAQARQRLNGQGVPRQTKALAHLRVGELQDGAQSVQGVVVGHAGLITGCQRGQSL